MTIQHLGWPDLGGERTLVSGSHKPLNYPLPTMRHQI